MDLPAVVESYKTYDDNVLIKTADIGQMIKDAYEGESIPEMTKCRHGLSPPLRDARRPRFRREPDLNPKVVHCVEKDLQNIMTSGTAEHIGVEMAEPEEDVHESARGAGEKVIAEPSTKPNVPEAETVVVEAEESDSDESDDSL